MPIVKILPGDGTEVMCEVAYCAPYPHGYDDQCAFCKGDPCNDDKEHGSMISEYYKRDEDAVTCPICEGRT